MSDKKGGVIPGPTSAKQEMIINSDAQITVIGGAAGSGKSYLLQVMALRYIDDPNTTCIMFRRTTPQLMGQGGIVDTAKSIYTALPKDYRPSWTQKPMQATFPNGATIRWQHMEHVRNKFDIQGLQYTFIGVDEACQFEWEQLEYMTSRLRSASRHKSRMVMSCNPDPDHKLREILEDFYLDEDGYPIPERDGVVRYFMMQNGDFIWGDTADYLADKYGVADEDRDTKILSFTFISSTIYDNPIMLKENREYLAFLEGLNEVDKAQLLHGNWFARAEGSTFFKREWLEAVDYVPDGAQEAVGYDKAASKPSQADRSPDYTACTKMSKCREGYYYITGDYIESFKDEDTGIYGRFRETAGRRDNLIEAQGHYDGRDCHIVMPQDPGAAGKMEILESCKKLTAVGLIPKKDLIPINKAKVTKFMPFATAAENGLVRIVKSTFKNAKSLEAYLKELDSFDGERSTAHKKDDWVDATATVFNYLTLSRTYKFTPRNQAKVKTLANDHLSNNEVPRRG
jgi:phage terminase large subunit-like protein